VRPPFPLSLEARASLTRALSLSRSPAVECFIEGTRSRTGKLLPPKLGILKNVLEALEQGRTEDVWICPISLQYDKVRPPLATARALTRPERGAESLLLVAQVIERESYVNELLGNPKEKET